MPNLDSMLLASTDPARLADWYVQALEPDDVDDVDDYRMLRFGSFHVLVDGRDEVSARNAEPARMILNFDVEDAAAVAERLDQMDVEWVAPLEDRDGSLFATAEDPDGNWVQVIQLSDEARADM